MSGVVNYGSAFGGIVAPQVTYKDFTVAPDDATDTSGYDFENLTKALEYVKQKGSQTYQSFGIRLILGDGEFTWGTSELLRQLVTPAMLWNMGLVTAFSMINLAIEGNGKDETKVKIVDEGIKVFDKSFLLLRNFTLDDENGKRQVETLESVLWLENVRVHDAWFELAVHSYLKMDPHCEFTTDVGKKILQIVLSSSVLMLIDISEYEVELINSFLLTLNGTPSIIPQTDPNSINVRGGIWMRVQNEGSVLTIAGSTTDTDNRPDDPKTGQPHFDTDLGLPIWYNGSDWVDATGATV